MNITQFPAQLLPLSRKGKEWKRNCVEWADSKLKFNYSIVRQSLRHLKINYDLMNGKIHMDDFAILCNPEGFTTEYNPDKIQHYPIINTKLELLSGEESRRVFDYRVVVTNPTALSEIEEVKRQLVLQSLQELLQDTQQTELEFNRQLETLNEHYTYEYLDYREIRANCLLNHYNKEQNFSLVFNNGFKDAEVVGEEIYQCDIVGGEPVLERLNPMKVRIFKSGTSNRIEDADMIVLEDYWSPGKVYDRFYDVLTEKDRKYLETLPDKFSQGAVDSKGNVDDTLGYVNANMVTDEASIESGFFSDPFGECSDGISNDLLPYDLHGNIRVIRVYWKSRRKIKKIKYYTEDGEEDFTFMPETYIPNEYRGEEEETFWINEAWEGTKIGQDIFVNIRPRPILYNSLDNPSRCHFGIVGSIYNRNDDKPYSLVDRMKPYNYLYDVIHDRLNRLMARNWGKMVRVDEAKIPQHWKFDKWLYYAKSMGIYIENSFNEGTKGAATGKLAASMNNNSLPVIDADFGNNIQQYINLLEFIKMEMSDVVGISKQREGEISNRETVGGVERATLQSSHITEWIFLIHDDVKRRALTVFLETAKAALRGRVKKFHYILPDSSIKLMEIDGDEFAECDYGLIVDSSNSSQELAQKIETLAQAALQNQALNFSTIMKLYNSASLAEKQRFVENYEKQAKQEAQEQQQMAMQQQQQALLAELQAKQQEQQFKDGMNQRDNETKITVAEINSQAEMAILQLKNKMTEADLAAKEAAEEPEDYSQEAKDKLLQEMKMLDKKLQLEREKLLFLKDKAKTDAEIKRSQIAVQRERKNAKP